MCKSIYEWKTNAYLNFLLRKKNLNQFNKKVFKTKSRHPQESIFAKQNKTEQK